LININFPIEVAKFIANESYSYPLYLGVGDSNTLETTSDTSLGNELYRESLILTNEDVVLIQTSEILSTTSVLYSETIKETGTFDLSSSGSLFDRSATNTGILFDAGTEVKITKFMAVDNSNSNVNYIFTDDGINELILSFKGLGDSPSHIAWGSDLIFDKCDALGSAPNNWTDDSSAATTPDINTSNVIEGTGSVNMGKDGTGSAVFSYKKDLASTIDASNVTYFYLDINIEESTDLDKLKETGSLQLRIGSSSSDYKYYSFDRASLNVGWQTLNIPVSLMTDTGSPNMAAIDYLGIFMETTNATDVITHGNLIMDYWRGYWSLNSTDTTLHNENFRDSITNPIRTGTSVFITSNMGLTEGNTYNYKFTGVFNDSSTGDLFFEFKSFDEVKSSVSQITSDITLSVRIYGYSN